MTFDISSMGTCVPIQCANPKDLVDDNGDIVGRPISGQAGINECIEYTCAVGFQKEGGRAVTSCCKNEAPSASVDDVGHLAFFGEIEGRCVRKYP